MIGEPFTTFNTERSAERALAAFESLLEGDDIDAVELELTTATGETVVLEVNGTPETEGGEIVGVHGVGRDITQQKSSQRELELKTKRSTRHTSGSPSPMPSSREIRSCMRTEDSSK